MKPNTYTPSVSAHYRAAPLGIWIKAILVTGTIAIVSAAFLLATRVA